MFLFFIFCLLKITVWICWTRRFIWISIYLASSTNWRVHIIKLLWIHRFIRLRIKYKRVYDFYLEQQYYIQAILKKKRERAKSVSPYMTLSKRVQSQFYCLSLLVTEVSPEIHIYPRRRVQTTLGSVKWNLTDRNDSRLFSLTHAILSNKIHFHLAHTFHFFSFIFSSPLTPSSSNSQL